MMICPCCSNEMSEEAHAGVQLDLCAVCPGVWFDWGELEAYKNGDAAATALNGVKLGSAHFEPTGDSLHVKCPRCEGDILRTGVVARRRVYRCTSCGGLFLPLPLPEEHQPRRPAVLRFAKRAFEEVVSALF